FSLSNPTGQFALARLVEQRARSCCDARPGREFVPYQLGQFRHGLSFEHLPRPQAQAGFARLGDDLDAEDGISSQLKEIVMYSDSLQVQQPRPDLAEGLLNRTARGDIAFLFSTLYDRRRQGLTIEFSIRQQWQPGQWREDGRNRMFRQTVPQKSPEFRSI